MENDPVKNRVTSTGGPDREQPTIKYLVENYLQQWHDTAADFPEFDKSYPLRSQVETEEHLNRFLDDIIGKLKQRPKLKSDQELWINEFLADIKSFAGNTLKIPESHLDKASSDGYVQTTRGFLDEIQDFDPQLKTIDLYQALRNAWIMNSLQLYFDFKIGFTPSIFAYSMIYPYSDNTLDSREENSGVKRSLLDHLGKWLRGESAPCRSANEEKIRKLIDRIEGEFPRNRYPGVYRSLLAIFNAQVKSQTQQDLNSRLSEKEILDISFEKGGTSVLADGYLVKGELNKAEADFCFGFGVFLQLSDDLQDIVEDLGNNRSTIFSSKAGKEALEPQANRLIRFTRDVTEQKLNPGLPNQLKLQQLILSSCHLLLIEAIGKQQEYFDDHYIKQLESSFPIRFSALKRLKQKVQKRIIKRLGTVDNLDFASALLLTLTSRFVSGD